MSQQDLVKATQIGQSTMSRIMSGQQAATDEQIDSIADALGVTAEALTKQDAPTFYSENQQGGHANNYYVENGLEALVAAKDETIAVLKRQIEILQKLLNRDVLRNE